MLSRWIAVIGSLCIRVFGDPVLWQEVGMWPPSRFLTVSNLLASSESSSFLTISKKSRCLRRQRTSAKEEQQQKEECWLPFLSGSPVQRGVFVLSQLIDDRLDAQHQKLVPEVEPELQVVLK